MADTGGTVVELRVHGVSGTPPEALLGCPTEFIEQVAGDKSAGFWRRRKWIDDASMPIPRRAAADSEMAKGHGGVLVGRADVGAGEPGGVAAVPAIHLHQPRALDVAARCKREALRRIDCGGAASAARVVVHADIDACRCAGGDGRNGLAVHVFGPLWFPTRSVVVPDVDFARRAGGHQRSAAGCGDRSAVALGPGECTGRRTAAAASRGDGERSSVGKEDVLARRRVGPANARLPCHGVERMPCRAGSSGAPPLHRVVHRAVDERAHCWSPTA